MCFMLVNTSKNVSSLKHNHKLKKYIFKTYFKNSLSTLKWPFISYFLQLRFIKKYTFKIWSTLQINIQCN